MSTTDINVKMLEIFIKKYNEIKKLPIIIKILLTKSI